jgi:hypothetical protein
MKKELIKTDNYLLVVDDSEIKKGDWFLSNDNEILKCTKKEDKFVWYERFTVPEVSKTSQPFSIHVNLNPKKVIAHLPLNDSPILEGVPLLAPLDVEDDVEKLNEDLFDKGSDNILHPQYQMRTFFNIGFNKAKEKYKFTEEDMINFACKVYNENYHKDDSFFTTAEALIKSFSQPKTPSHFDFTMHTVRIPYGDDGWQTIETVIKTTTNSQGQQVACGKYIY